MGHVRLGTLPKSRKWRQVVELLVEGAGAAEIAAASTDAAEHALRIAAKDPALVRAFWLLTQIPLAARTADFPAALQRLDLPVKGDPTLMEVVGAFAEAIDRHARRSGGRTDLGEMAQLSAAEALSTIAARDLPALFGPSPGDVKLAIGKLASTKQFGILAREFFTRLTKRHLDYYLSREMPDHVGAGARFSAIADHSAFDAALDLHCREASRIVQEFSGSWFSKKNFEDSLTPDEAGRFAYVAFKKLRDELRQRRDDDG